jgi:DNA primase
MQSLVLRELRTKAAAQFAELLTGSPADTYLRGRGIPPEVSDTFLLGYVSDPEPEYSQFEGMLSIPYLTPAGVVGLKFRRLDGAEPKYMNVSGQESHLFNVLDLHKKSDFIVICEGELDAIMSSGTAGVPTVGVSGVTHWKPHYQRLFTGYRRVIVVTDNDVKDAGANAGQDLSRKILRELPNATNVLLPANLDITDYCMQHGIETYRHMVTPR